MRKLAAGMSGYVGLALIIAIHFSFSGVLDEPRTTTESVPVDPSISPVPIPRDLEHTPLADVIEPTRIRAETVSELEATFRTLNYAWPPDAEVPPLVVQRLPEDLSLEIAVERRKALFFGTLLPLALLENKRVRELRNQVEELLAGGMPPEGTAGYQWLSTLGNHYRVSVATDHSSFGQELLKRVDEVPVALTLAQAAIESGWGTSRFTREANNLFGIWTWDTSAGIKPERRREGMNHAIRRYDTLRGSVRSYVYNLNSGHAYSSLRESRAALRRAGLTPDAMSLAEGLDRYSERGHAYVREVQTMIRSNSLHRLADVTLCRTDCELEALADR